MTKILDHWELCKSFTTDEYLETIKDKQCDYCGHQVDPRNWVRHTKWKSHLDGEKPSKALQSKEAPSNPFFGPNVLSRYGNYLEDRFELEEQEEEEDLDDPFTPKE